MMTLEYALQIRMSDKNMTDRKYRPSKSTLCESHSHSYAGQQELDIKAWIAEVFYTQVLLGRGWRMPSALGCCVYVCPLAKK